MVRVLVIGRASTSASGPSRHSVAAQQLDRFWIEADMSRLHLNGSPASVATRTRSPACPSSYAPFAPGTQPAEDTSVQQLGDLALRASLRALEIARQQRHIALEEIEPVSRQFAADRDVVLQHRERREPE